MFYFTFRNEKSRMTSWLRGSTIRSSLGRRSVPESAAALQDVDPAAAFHTFNKHWQQTSDIISRTTQRKQVNTIHK